MYQSVDLDRVAALLSLERVAPEEAVAIGDALLVEGWDDASVVELASLLPGEHGPALELLASVLEAYRVPIPSRKRAAHRLSEDAAEAITAGTVDPIEGARSISKLWSEYRWPEFAPFVGLLDDLDVVLGPEERGAVALAIVAYAAEVVGTGKVDNSAVPRDRRQAR